MERTYDTLVDNGLFVVAYYLNKDIEEVTIDNIKGITGEMAKLYVKMDNVDYYKGMAYSCFQNTRYTQANKNVSRDEYIKEQYDVLLDNIGDDEYCTVCGKKHIDVNFARTEKSISSTMRPRISSGAFFNYSNNLAFTNVCPVCLTLGMMSIFNIEKNGTCVLMDSDNDEYMYNRTDELQTRLSENIAMNAAEKKKDRKLMYEQVLNKITDSEIYDAYIRITSFMNSSQLESWQEEFLSSRDMRFIKEVQGKGLISEFNQANIFAGMIRGIFQKDYTWYVCNVDKGEIKVSNELLKLIEEGYGMNKNKLAIIDRMCNAMYEKSGGNLLRDAKGIATYSDLQDLLVDWIEATSEIDLITSEEYQSLTSVNDWKAIKRTITVKLIQLNK